MNTEKMLAIFRYHEVYDKRNRAKPVCYCASEKDAKYIVELIDNAVIVRPGELPTSILKK